MLDINDSELLALHRFILENKFSMNSNDIAFSPLMADVANKVLDTIIENSRKNNFHEYENWIKWRLLNKSKIEWVFIIEKIKNDKYWNDFNEEQKMKHLKILSSPFTITENIFIDFVNAL